MAFTEKRIARGFNVCALGAERAGFSLVLPSNDDAAKPCCHRDTVRDIQRIGLPGGYQE